ncbi:MAG: SpoIIIAH-like family protein [Lachnospiraceae bacterium]|nr:SpoIIIAH-like family protein [Lachnospiraceae bacterium]
MKKLFKKNQMIITTLAIMVAIAGYLNYSGQILEETADTVSSDDSTVLLTDEIEENTYVDTYTDIVSLDGDGLEDSASDESEASGTTEAAVGEAVLASTGVSSASEILAAAKLSREQVRSKSKEELQEIIDSADLTEEEKQEAVTAMTTLTVNAQKESAAELLLEASGYTDCVVSMTEDTVDVVVNASSLTEAQRAQIEDIVKRKTEVAGENIVITPAAATVSETAAAESAGADVAAEDTESAETVSAGETE